MPGLVVYFQGQRSLQQFEERVLSVEVLQEKSRICRLFKLADSAFFLLLSRNTNPALVCRNTSTENFSF